MTPVYFICEPDADEGTKNLVESLNTIAESLRMKCNYEAARTFVEIMQIERFAMVCIARVKIMTKELPDVNTKPLLDEIFELKAYSQSQLLDAWAQWPAIGLEIMKAFSLGSKDVLTAATI